MEEKPKKRVRLKRRQVELRRKLIYELYASGKTGAEIAKTLAISPQMVSYHLDAIFHEAARGRQEELLQLLQMQRIELERIKVEARESFESSKKVLDEKINDGVRYVVLAKDATVSGNPIFLDVQMKAIDRITKLFGLDKPVKIAMTDSKGEDLKTPQEVWASILDMFISEKTDDTRAGNPGKSETLTPQP